MSNRSTGTSASYLSGATNFGAFSGVGGGGGSGGAGDPGGATLFLSESAASSSWDSEGGALTINAPRAPSAYWTS